MMDWVSLLGEISFPILVTFYLLTRIESKLEQLSLSIQSLSNRVAQLPKQMIDTENNPMA